MKKQQKDELNNELKEENIMLQRKLQGRLCLRRTYAWKPTKLSLCLVPSQNNSNRIISAGL